ncbi:MAG: hypothetical protein JXA42_10030 [Anaerolineales bacterium]|nr:hypothetical protein [Anaerolineales bacterium]
MKPTGLPIKQLSRLKRWDEEFPEDPKNGSVFVMYTYYQRPFSFFHLELEKHGFDTTVPHPIRKRFWGLLPHRVYSPIEGRKLVERYLDSVERELISNLKSQSIAYWLHLYRRLFPGPIGADQQWSTIGLTRAALESAVQRSAMFHLCDKIAISDQIPLTRVLGGLLMHPDFERERETVKSMSQLVLTDFTSTDLKRFYDVERLAYEAWRGSAQLRALGKGASLFISDHPETVSEKRSPELNQLIRSYDTRLESSYEAHTMSGVVFEHMPEDSEKAGIVFLPTYNIGKITSEEISPLFERVFNLRLFGIGQDQMVPNFVWIPFNLKRYRDAHLPYSDAFKTKYSVDLDAVLIVIAALCLRVFFIWNHTGGIALMRYWQRAYEGPLKWEYVVDEIMAFLQPASQVLGLDQIDLSQLDILAAISFWDLRAAERSDLDITYPGPHCTFLPFGEDRVFIDYAWIARRLYDLFVEVWIPDQNFKGDALESLVCKKISVLPTRPCRSQNGLRKQIDAAFECGDRLIIVECRAVGKSIGYDRGNPEAIEYRRRIVDKALKDADNKAHWLSSNPSGTNYDIRRYRDILPLAVTPFVEFIPSLDSRYWVSTDLPRVMTSGELRKALDDRLFTDVSSNTVPIRNAN